MCVRNFHNYLSKITPESKHTKLLQQQKCSQSVQTKLENYQWCVPFKIITGEKMNLESWKGLPSFPMHAPTDSLRSFHVFAIPKL